MPLGNPSLFSRVELALQAFDSGFFWGAEVRAAVLESSVGTAGIDVEISQGAE